MRQVNKQFVPGSSPGNTVKAIRPQRPKRSKAPLLIIAGVIVVGIFVSCSIINSPRTPTRVQSKAKPTIRPLSDGPYGLDTIMSETEIHKRRELGISETYDYHPFVVVESDYYTGKTDHETHLPVMKTFMRTPIEVKPENYTLLMATIEKHKAAARTKNQATTMISYLLPLNSRDNNSNYFKVDSLDDPQSYRNESAQAKAIYEKNTQATLTFLALIFGHKDGVMHSFPDALVLTFPPEDERKLEQEKNRNERRDYQIAKENDNFPMVCITTVARPKGSHDALNINLMSDYLEVKPSNYEAMTQLQQKHWEIRKQRSDMGKADDTDTRVIYFPPVDGSDGSKVLRPRMIAQAWRDDKDFMGTAIKVVFGQYDGKQHNAEQIEEVIKNTPAN